MDPNTTATAIDETPLSASPERRSSLEKHLQRRPDVQDLKDRHILLDTNVAPYVPLLPSTHHPYIVYLLEYLTEVLDPSKQPAKNLPANAPQTP